MSSKITSPFNSCANFSASSFANGTSTIITLAPSRCKTLAAAAPIPRAPPVTIAILSCNNFTGTEKSVPYALFNSITCPVIKEDLSLKKKVAAFAISKGITFILVTFNRFTVTPFFPPISLAKALAKPSIDF